MAEAPVRGFPPQEFADRTKRAQSRMLEAGIDAVLLTTEAELRYFSGYLTQFWQSPTRPWFMIIPATGKPIAVIPAIGATCMGRTWIEDIRTWSSPQPEDEGISLLVETMKETIGTGGILGISEGPETHLRMPVSDYRRMMTLLPGFATRDCSAILRDLRMVKSEAEITKITHVCSLVSDVFEDLPNFIHPV